VPGSLLENFVKCYWTLEAPAAEYPEKQRIVPDGCMEMIFHYGNLYEQFSEDGSSIKQPRCFVFGQITSPLEISPTGVTGIVAARFQPDGFAPFVGIAVSEMENKAVELKVLFGEEGLNLEEKVLAEKTNEARIKVIEKFLLQALQRDDAINRITKQIVQVLLESNGQMSVDDLAEGLQINRRQLERKFSSAIGLSPKQLSKMIRLQNTLKMMGQKQFTSLTSLAYENGYFDQAHFIKDFKEFTGVSPKQFYGENLKLSSLFTGAE
jgi:AraC-like DNA-binding protein